MLLRGSGVGLLVLLISTAFGGADESAIQSLTELEPHQAMTKIDSLQAQGTLDQREALALRIQALNRPGYWTAWGSQTAAFFDEAFAEFSRESLASQRDSVSYYTLLLDFAYFNARASFATLADPHNEYAQAEQDCLRRVLNEAPLDWQTARAAFELGRYHRFRSAPYIVSMGNRCDVALEYLRFVLERHGGTAFVNAALWNLTGLLAETGHTERAFEALALLDDRGTGTKWEERARRLRSMISRQEFFVDSIEKDSSRLVIRGQARNIKGRVDLHLDEAREPDFERRGRLPFAHENAGWSNRARNHVIIDADRRGAAWRSFMPLPSAGVYRLNASFEDTTISHTVGVWDIALEVTSGDTTLFIRSDVDAEAVVSIRKQSGSWAVVGMTEVTAGDPVACDLPTRSPFQVYLGGGTHVGWNGPKLWAPSFEMWLDD
jgi:hypothetical protein